MLPQGRCVDFISIPIDRCRHYGGYCYGADAFNPYENYVVGLHRCQSFDVLRQNFETFLRYFRPRTFGELLDIPLSQAVPLWVYPWYANGSIDPRHGWPQRLEDVPDIITHFCEQGIQRSRIEEEYFWLASAYETIASLGYRPAQFSYIEVLELREGGSSVYIVRDGNHRLSALAALGHRDVLVKRDPLETIDAADANRWPQVLSGLYTRADAMALFRRYFRGVEGFRKSDVPARIIEA